jgi:molybdopterin converting factor small subunit
MPTELRVHIPTPLRQYADSKSAIEVSGASVSEALASLTTQHPELRKHLYSEDGRLRAFVNVYLNDDDIRYLEKENTAIRSGDSISIVPSIAGGSMEHCRQMCCHCDAHARRRAGPMI